MNIQEVIKKSVTVVMARVIGAGISFALTILLSRILGAKDFGFYSLGLVVITMLAMLSRFGLDTVVLKQVAANYQSNVSLAKGYLVSTIFFILFISLFFNVVIYLLADILASRVFFKPEFSYVIESYSLSLVPLSVLFVLVAALKSIGFPVYASIAQTILVPLVVAVVAIVLYINNQVSLSGIIVSYFFAVLLAALISFSLLSVQFLKVKVVTIKWMELFVQGWPMLLVSSSALVISWTDIIILGIFSSAENIGIYTAASKIVLITSLLLVAINSITAPRYAKLYANNKIDEIRVLAQSSSMILLALILLPTLCVFLFSKEIMGLLGNDFMVGSTVLVILVVGQLINVACGSVGYLLSMTGNEKKLRDILLYTATLNIILSFILVREFQMIGVALSTTISMFVWNIWSLIEVKKKLGFWTLHVEILKKLGK